MRKFVVKCVETKMYLAREGVPGGITAKPEDARPYMDEGRAAAVALAVTSVTTNTYRVIPV